MAYDDAMTVRLLQLSDCHLLANAADCYRGINPEQHLQKMLSAALNWQPDLLVLSGDLVECAQPQVYQRLNRFIDALSVRTMAFPGNHDDGEMLRRHLDAAVFDHDNPLRCGAWQLVWIDSNVAGQPHGELSADKLAVLNHIDPQAPTLLFMHHQPDLVGTPWIDRYTCRNPELLWHWLQQHEHTVRAICFGHIHHAWRGERTINQRSIALLGAPSSSACVVPGSSEFVLDVRGPRGRWLQLADAGTVHTGLLSSA